MLDLIETIVGSRVTWFVVGVWFGVGIMAILAVARDE